MSRKLRVRVGDRWYSVEVEDLTTNPIRVLVDGEPVDVERLSSLNAPRSVEADVEPAPPESAEAPTPLAPAAHTHSAARAVRSPMPGVIVSVAVKEGDRVVAGDEICVLEAMKMHQTLRADSSGTVTAVYVSPGQQVLDGAPLAELE